jgi:alkylated DNA repair dioxygenase AlkB
MAQFTGKRRTVTFGWSYNFGRGEISEADPLPGFLVPLRDRAASFGKVPAEALTKALVTDYGPGGGIDWDRDAPPFGIVMGISLLSDCRFRLRISETQP